MDLRTIISAPKTEVRSGDWRSGEIPRAQWPSRRAKARAYKFGPAYRWRIISFCSVGYEFRLRLLLNESKQIFRASLGLMVSGETVPLCDYEWHASEPGWHCHAKCEDFRRLNANFNRFGTERLPAAKSYHRRREFRFKRDMVSEANALNCAVDFFRLDRGGGIL